MTTHTPGAPPARGLARLGQWSARRPWRVLAIWALTLAVLASLSATLHATFTDNVTLNGTQANAGGQLIAADFPGAGASSGLVVLHAKTPLVEHRELIEASVRAIVSVEHVTGASAVFSAGAVSSDGRTAYTRLSFDVASRGLPASVVVGLDRAVAPLRAAGISVAYGGGLDQVTQPRLNDRNSEALGFAIALAILLAIFGSVLGAGLPLITALVGVGVGVSILDVVGATTSFSVSAPKLAVMIGLGVGIDYAVFLTTRFRQLVADGADAVPAAASTTATSGRAIILAACTVSIAMLGLYASGLIFIGKLGLAAVFAVVAAAAAAVTLVPALLGLAGRRIDALRLRRPVAETGKDADAWHRYAGAIGRRPWTYLLAGLVVLAVLAAPALSLQMGHVGDGANPTSFTSRVAYDEMAGAFGPGINGPFSVVVSYPASTTSVASLEAALRSTLLATPDVAEVGPIVASTHGAALLTSVIPRTGPQNQATSALFTRLVHVTLPALLAPRGAHADVTGETPSQIEFDQLIAQRTPLIIAVVVVLAFLLIMAVFRSLLLAIKAAVLNLFSIAAAWGILVVVFQWGWGRQLLGLNERVPIEAYVPMVLFAIVFGLSMDYEIFLLSRVKEAWNLNHDNHESVAAGLARTGRVITAAALIMVAVFLSFVSTPLVTIKQLAVGLAASVAIDATVIRLLLVPATMYLFGDKNWWLPGWLDRLLPHVGEERAMPDDARAAR